MTSPYQPPKAATGPTPFVHPPEWKIWVGAGLYIILLGFVGSALLS